MKVLSRTLTGVLGALLCLLLASPALGLEPPRPGDLQEYARNATLAERLAFARSLGNYKVAPGLVGHLKQEIGLARLGLPDTPMLPPPASRGMPTTGTVKIFALLISSRWSRPTPGATHSSRRLSPTSTSRGPTSRSTTKTATA